MLFIQPFPPECKQRMFSNLGSVICACLLFLLGTVLAADGGDESAKVEVVFSQWSPALQSSNESNRREPGSTMQVYECFVSDRVQVKTTAVKEIQNQCEATIENGRSPLDSSYTAALKSIRTASLDFLSSHPTVAAAVPGRILEKIPKLVAWVGDGEDNKLDGSLRADPTNSDWKHFQWDEGVDKQGAWGNYIPSSEEAHGDIIDVALESSLSKTGGMHPQVSHCLRVKPAKAYDTVANGGLDGISFSVLVWVDVPPSIFVNVEDAFLWPAADDIAFRNISIRMIHNQNTVIDQEEPSFANPQHHAIFYLIKGTLPLHTAKEQSAADGSLVEIRWDSLLHSRYQTPDESGRRTISIMSPTVVITFVADQSRTMEQAYVSFLPHLTPITHSVATGQATHLIPVLLMTILVSIGGTLVLLRELSIYHHHHRK